MKLEHYELMHHFSFGGYGDRHVDRNGVAEEALAASREHVDGDVDPEQVWVVGDTPLDISCARAIGAKVVAVATGWHDRQRLEDAAPTCYWTICSPPRRFCSTRWAERAEV